MLFLDQPNEYLAMLLLGLFIYILGTTGWCASLLINKEKKTVRRKVFKIIGITLMVIGGLVGVVGINRIAKTADLSLFLTLFVPSLAITLLGYLIKPKKGSEQRLRYEMVEAIAYSIFILGIAMISTCSWTFAFAY